MQMATVRLTDLLPTNGYLLPYALSLFFASLVLTFAGAFLTLDRTRSFAPTSDVFQDKQKSTSMFIASVFRGGVGGILTGFVFGVHFTTFLSLLIPSVTSSQPLKPAPYLSVLFLSSLVTSVAAGRWKYFAFAASGFCGGGSLALAVSVTIHPSLLTRIVLTAVLASLLATLAPLPIARVQPMLLRTSSSAVGSFGLVISIALFSRVEPWSNVWERLWVRGDILWGSAQERGLSVAFFLFLVSGVTTDWWLRFKFGENPDQKWDSYLAQYVANLPEGSSRAGTFHPFASIWRRPPFKHPRFEPISPSAASQEKDDSKCGRDKWMGNDHILKAKTRRDAKFRPLNCDDSTDSETETGHVSNGGARHVKLHPWLAEAGSVTSTHSSAPTVLEGVQSRSIHEKDPYRAHSRTHLSTSPEGSDLPNYSDHEINIRPDLKSTRHGPSWTPLFFQNKSRVLKPHIEGPHITRLDEIVSGAGRSTPSHNPRESPKRNENPRWQAFWRDVDDRIERQELSRINVLTT